MQRLIEQVEPAYLKQVPPRQLPYAFTINLFLDYLFERSYRAFLDPLLLTSVVSLLSMLVIGASAVFVVFPLLVMLVRLGSDFYQIWRHVGDDLALLRKGVTVKSYVKGLRAYRDPLGEIEGALLDFIIPVAPRRTYVGTVWLSDAVEALQLARQGQVEVICLPNVPGTWRISQDISSTVRYRNVGLPRPSVNRDVG